MKFGTDPEYLIVNRLGRPVPAHKAGIPDKDNKLVLKEWTTETWESRCFRDGYMVEINIQPDQCRQTTTFRMQRALQALKRKLAPAYHIVAVPAVRINLERDMKNAPADVMQFGCEPSCDAYTGEMKVPPIDALTHPYRYAGGHLHFGYDYRAESAWMLNRSNHPKFIKLMDLYVGAPLSFLFDSKQTFLRRRFYGQAGEFRSQKYGSGKEEVGVEYRTPGPEVWNAAWVASFAMGVGRHIALNFRALAKKWDKHIEADLQLAINTGAGLSKMLRLTRGLEYDEYPRSFHELKAFRPKGIELIRCQQQTVYNGLRDWAQHNQIDLCEVEERYWDE